MRIWWKNLTKITSVFDQKLICMLRVYNFYKIQSNFKSFATGIGAFIQGKAGQIYLDRLCLKSLIFVPGSEGVNFGLVELRLRRCLTF